MYTLTSYISELSFDKCIDGYKNFQNKKLANKNLVVGKQ